MRNILVKSLLVATSFCLLQNTCFAWYIVEAPPQKEAHREAAVEGEGICQSPGVFQIGEKRNAFASPGFGREMPLRTALSLIIPQDYKIFIHPTKQDIPVTWESNGKFLWYDFLAEITKDHNLCVTIRNNEKLVFVDPFVKKTASTMEATASTMAPSKNSVPQNDISSSAGNIFQNGTSEEIAVRKPVNETMNPGGFTTGYEHQNATIASSGENTVNLTDNDFGLNRTNAQGHIIATKLYTLNAGERVSEQMRNWLDSEGWKLYWELTEDWVVPSHVELTAKDILDAVNQIAVWMHRQGAQVQFIAYTKNKVLLAKSLQPKKNNM